MKRVFVSGFLGADARKKEIGGMIERLFQSDDFFVVWNDLNVLNCLNGASYV